MRVFDAGRGWFERVVFSPDGRRVAAADGRVSNVWAFDTGGDEPRWMQGQSATALCFYPDANWLLASTGYHTVLLDWAGRVADELEGPMDKAVQFTVARDGRLVSLHGGAPGFGDYRPRVRTWQAGSGGDPEPGSEVILTEDQHSPWLLWPGGDRVARMVDPATPDGPRSAVLFSVPDLREAGTFAVPFWGFRSVAVGPDGDRLAAYDVGGLNVWTGPDWSGRPRRVKKEGRKHFTGLAFHPSGRYLAATSNDATVKLYDTATWQVAKTYTWDVGRMRSVAFSPDGTLAAAGTDTGKVVVWDVDV